MSPQHTCLVARTSPKISVPPFLVEPEMCSIVSNTKKCSKDTQTCCESFQIGGKKIGKRGLCLHPQYFGAAALYWQSAGYCAVQHHWTMVQRETYFLAFLSQNLVHSVSSKVLHRNHKFVPNSVCAALSRFGYSDLAGATLQTKRPQISLSVATST